MARIWFSLNGRPPAPSVTVDGALISLVSAPNIGPHWPGLLLAIHAGHGEWKRRAAARAVRIS